MRLHPLFDIEPAELAHLRTLARDQAIAVAAASRDGVLTHPQLVAIGVSPTAIRGRVRRGLLFVRHRGIYAVGRFDLTRRGRLRAALLRCGRSAVLSHHSAASQADLLAVRERVAITVTGTRKRPDRRSGIDLHYTDRWCQREVLWVGGLPCTSVARTVADLAGQADPRDFSRTWNRADRRLLLDVGDLGAQIVRERAGCGLIRAKLDHHTEAPPTESELEDMYLDLSDAAGLPRPVAQLPLVAGDRSGRVDFVYVAQRLVVELDSRTWHAIQAAYERDREKDLLLREAGCEPHRYTWRQVRDQGPRVIATVGAALAARQPS